MSFEIAGMHDLVHL